MSDLPHAGANHAAPIDLWVAAQARLEATGWSVDPPSSEYYLRAEREGRTLVGLVCTGCDTGELEEAYRQILESELGGGSAPDIRALVIAEDAFHAAIQVPLEARERLSIALLVVGADGQVGEPSLEPIASIDIPVGPAAWRNWRAYDHGFPPNQRTEHGLYSDSDFVGELCGLGPYDVINTVSRTRPVEAGIAQQILVLRHTWHLPRMAFGGKNPPEKETDNYYDGWVGDEIAALLSVALNMRCADGGPIRDWFQADDLDGLGRPSTFFHRKPPLEIPKYRRPILPRIARDSVNLADARPYLESYAAMGTDAALAIVRASRQFQQAVWIADDSPGLAWLLLVGALETAASYSVADKAPLDTLRAMKPGWATALEHSTAPGKDAVIDELGKIVGAGKKVRTLVRAHCPPPPAQRPGPPFAIRWNKKNLVTLVDRIYGLRSDVLHQGLPFPGPMLDPPHTQTDPPAERPGATIGQGDSVWTAEDMPMYLHVFANIVGHVLRSWWQTIASDRYNV